MERLLTNVDVNGPPEVGYSALVAASDYNPKDFLGSPLLKHVDNVEDLRPENCDAEYACTKTPEWVQYPGRPEPVPVVLCFNRDCSPRHEIKLDELKIWSIDMLEIARRVAGALAISGSPVEILPTRLFRLGREPGQGLTVYFSRGELRQDEMPDADVLLTMCYRRFRGVTNPPGLTIRPLWEVFEPVHEHEWKALPDALPIRRDDTQWITVTQAAELLRLDFPYLSAAKAKARVSAAAGRGSFKTNGRERHERRINAESFDSWRLTQRQRDLDAEDDD